MAGGECLEKTSDSIELVAGNSVGNNQNAGVGAMFIEKLNREPDEIIFISGDKAPFLLGGKPPLGWTLILRGVITALRF